MAETKRSTANAGPAAGLDFLRTIVEEDVRAGKHGGRVATRFPPEPNGYLHIGHATSICLNFGIAEEHGGSCNLRYDDTNPTTEDLRYAEAIAADVRWLGFEWNELLYASDYFERLYEWAEQLIEDGNAYVDSLSEEEIRDYRGTVTEAGRESPYRERSIEENLELFRRMRGGEFADGEHVLRAKIDMSHPNMKMRDPLLYRIRHARHYRTGDDWCIYPMYDYAHPLSDAIEGITHSFCTLEFENNRAIYDWLIENVDVPAEPHQYEFARFNLDYTVMSKRKLLQLVEEGRVSGWDDPRMPTLAGMRRRGVTPESLRSFCDLIGIAKSEKRVDIGKLEYAVRDDLNLRAPRVMCVLRPLVVVISNYPADRVEELEAPFYPHDVPKEGSRRVPFSRRLYIERTDFMEDPPKSFFRLAPGREVRLRYGYIIRCDEVVKDHDGNVVELRCSYDPETRGGSTPDGRRVRGTIHWVSAAESVPVEVRLYDRLFSVANPDEAAANTGKSFVDFLNPESLVTLSGCRLEPAVADAPPGTHFQFERHGYFYTDRVDSTEGALVFNRVVTLRDTWAKVAEAEGIEVEDAASEGRAASAPPDAAGEPADADARRKRTKRSKAELRAAARAADSQLAARYERYVRDLGLGADEADLLTGNHSVADLFEATLAAHDDPRAAANWIVNELAAHFEAGEASHLPFGGVELGALLALIDEGMISATAAKDVLAAMVEGGGDPRRIVEERGLQQLTDPAAIAPCVEQVIAAHPDKVDQYRGGRTGLLGFFVGQVMRRTGGAADPELVQKLLRERLE